MISKLSLDLVLISDYVFDNFVCDDFLFCVLCEEIV